MGNSPLGEKLDLEDEWEKIVGAFDIISKSLGDNTPIESIKNILE